MSPHTLRHSLQHLLENGADLRAVRRCWGIQTYPPRRYIHVTRKRLKEVLAVRTRVLNEYENCRVVIIVMDSVGVGALPDAADYGDEGSNTLAILPDTLGAKSAKHAEVGRRNIIDILRFLHLMLLRSFR